MSTNKKVILVKINDIVMNSGKFFCNLGTPNNLKVEIALNSEKRVLTVLILLI